MLRVTGPYSESLGQERVLAMIVDGPSPEELRKPFSGLVAYLG